MERPSFRTLRLLQTLGDSVCGVGGGLLGMGDLVWSSCGGEETFDVVTVFRVWKLFSELSRLFSDPRIITVPLWYILTGKMGHEWLASS